MHSNVDLMNQIIKINNIAAKKEEINYVENMLVIDGTAGQNILTQIESFDAAINLNSIVFTKIDSSSRGGIIISIYDRFNIPVKFLGTGENIDDWCTFNFEYFLSSLFFNC